MITLIGIVAGEIWHYLDKHERSTTMNAMVKDLERPREVVLMSLGWLGREGHVLLEESGDDYRITLRS